MKDSHSKLMGQYALILTTVLVTSCKQGPKSVPTVVEEPKTEKIEGDRHLVTDLFTADPSAHVFDDTIYIYPSHDFESGIPEDDLGSHFAMKDYHVYSMESVDGDVKDHGAVLDVVDVAWADKQMWAPDAAEKDGTYYLYFPAKDKDGVFRIGVAVSDSPSGPFAPKPEPIKGSYSIDPAVFKDGEDHYMYFGGIWGGQLQWYRDNVLKGKEDLYPEAKEPALSPKVAKLSGDMLEFAETPKDVSILDENGEPLKTEDNDRRFFEAAWMHTYNGKYYLSYSTGDTHNIAYAMGDGPYGPFTYKGVILKPVLGWTNHHSIIEFKGKWYLFYHDSSLSGGKTYLRSIKMTELEYNGDGTIKTLDKMVSMDTGEK